MAKQTFVTGQVLTASQVRALQYQTYNWSVNAKTASYTLDGTEGGTRIEMSSASATTITVNTSLFSAGDSLFIYNKNAGICTVTAGTATVSTAGSLALGQYDGGTLYFVSTGVAIFFSATSTGDVTLTATQTLQNKTLTSPTINTPVITSPKIGCTYTAKTAAYTFASGDEGNLFSMNNAATQQFNIPTDATFNFAVGTEFNVFWVTGAGQPTIGATTPGTTAVISTGATSATPKLRVANSGATVKKLAANSWIVFGDLS